MTEPRKSLVDMTDAELDAERGRRHAELYPDGCREPGHSCDACLERLGQVAHRTASRRVGRRIGTYLGTVEHRCLEPGCRWTS